MAVNFGGGAVTVTATGTLAPVASITVNEAVPADTSDTATTEPLTDAEATAEFDELTRYGATPPKTFTVAEVPAMPETVPGLTDSGTATLLVTVMVKVAP